MGILNRFKYGRGGGGPSPSSVTADGETSFETLLTEPEIHVPVTTMMTIMVIIGTLRILFNKSHLKAVEGTHTLDLGALNNACMYKEVFLAYLNAALLEYVSYTSLSCILILACQPRLALSC